MNSAILKEKLREAVLSVLPITLIVLLLTFTLAPVSTSTLIGFLFGAVLLTLGMGLFSLGADTAMQPIGERCGVEMTKSRKLWVVVLISFIVGTIVTIAEPDLSVLATQVPTIDTTVLILAVAVGVGLFLVVALLRILFAVAIRYFLFAAYALLFLLLLFVPREIISVAFDSGGVTTGPITVPFIMALGIGVASIRSDKHASNDSFGLVALCSVGPILAVMLLGMIYPSAQSAYTPTVLPEADTSRELARLFLDALPHYLKEVGISLLPIVAFFLVYNAAKIRMRRKPLIKILIGILYTYVGLALFLTGVNVGFMPAGSYVGTVLAGTSYRWILIPVGMLMGWFIVQAEPAVHVLNHQVEEITSGAIEAKSMQTSLSIGVSISIGLSMLRVLTGLNILWLIVPGYALAISLSFFVPKIFTSIAFDSGGVASGPMTATFLLPFAMGACEAVNGNIVTDAFGLVSMVAMTPLITIQLMGLMYQRRSRAQEQAEPVLDAYEIIEFE